MFCTYCIGGPRSDLADSYFLGFTHSIFFFKRGHFEEGATLLSPLEGTTLIRVNVGERNVFRALEQKEQNWALNMWESLKSCTVYI